jgi:alkylation response protein AidB-like acyl-CoA dehydrogenase
MHFDFSAEEKNRCETLAAHVEPALEEALEASATAGGAVKTALSRLASAGYLTLGLTAEAPEGAAARLAAMEALAARAPALFLTVECSTRLLGRTIATWGTPAQKTRWLEGLTAGGWLGALALSEQTLNVDNDPLETRGEPRKGEVVLNGYKGFVVNAPLAERVGVVGYYGAAPAVFMLDRRAPGLEIDTRISTMGYDGLHIAALRFNACRLAEADIIRPPGEEDLLARLRLWENEVLMAAALGLMQAALNEARTHAKTHRTGGKPIIAYQEVGFKLAEMLTLQQTAQLLAYRAAWAALAEPKAAVSLNWCAKVFCTEAAERVCGEALRILGAAGFRAGSAAAKAYRAVKLTQISGTSTEIARVKIGDDALGYRR